MRSLLHRLIYGGSGRFRDYEAACLEAAKRVLPDDAQKSLQAQIQALLLVQRSSDDKMVAVHYAEGETNEPPRYVNRRDELRIATVKAKRNPQLRCGIVLHKGRLSSLEFSANPRELNGAVAEDFDVELHYDPSSAQSGEEGISPAGSTVSHIAATHTVESVEPPANEADIEALTSRVAAPLPADLVALLRETDGFRIGDWMFLGTRARSAVRKSGTFHIVAEASSSALGFQERQGDGTVKRYNQLTDDVIDAGENFVDALSRAVSSPPL